MYSDLIACGVSGVVVVFGRVEWEVARKVSFIYISGDAGIMMS